MSPRVQFRMSLDSLSPQQLRRLRSYIRNSVQNPRLVAAFAANAGLIPLVAAITDSVALVLSAVHCFGCR
jgi:hypothetical protein